MLRSSVPLCCCEKTLWSRAIIEESLFGLGFQRVSVHNGGDSMAAGKQVKWPEREAESSRLQGASTKRRERARTHGVCEPRL